MQNLGREGVIALKQRRRTLKNRGYAVQCRLRRQQYKDSLEMQVRQLQEQLKKCEDERDFYLQYYQYYLSHPYHNHEAGDYKRESVEEMKVDPVDLRRDLVDLNAGNREGNTGKLEIDERFGDDQLAEELVAAGEDPAALGVDWRKAGRVEPDKQLVQEQQVGQSNGFGGLEAVGGLTVSSLAEKIGKQLEQVHKQQAGRSNGFEAVGSGSVSSLAAAAEDGEAVKGTLGLHKVTLSLRHF